MPLRLCSKVGCSREATATLTYDYAERLAAVGPLAPAGDPHAHDLCAEHTRRLTVPHGWSLLRHASVPAPTTHHDVGAAR